MKAHLAGIVARRVAATMHIAPIPAALVISSPPPLPHSTSLIQLSPNISSRQSMGGSASLSHTNSVPVLSPPGSPRSPRVPPPSQPPRSPSALRRPSVPSSSSPSLTYSDTSVQTPPLPLNAEEELIQCTFILYVMLDAVHNKMKNDDLVLRQLYSILPELYPQLLLVSLNNCLTSIYI